MTSSRQQTPLEDELRLALIATIAVLTRSTTRARPWDKLCNVLVLSDIVSIEASGIF